MIENLLKNIAISTEKSSVEEIESLRKMSEELGLPLLDACSKDFNFHFFKINNKLYLENGGTRICVDFSSGEANYRREHGGGKNQPIGRAIGTNKRKDLTVLDATAGLGGDSFVIACLGCRVTMLERSLVISTLLSDGLERGLMDSEIIHIIEQMSLINVDAEKYFLKIISENEERPDVVYLDPMYPHRKKSAKVKKEMQMLQRLLGHDEDASFLSTAMQVAKQRVVVKRPKGAEFLNDSAPTHSIESKKTRYDVYMC